MEKRKRKLSERQKRKLRLKELENIKLKPIEIDRKWGFRDKAGNIVIPCEWEDAWSFSEGLARVKDDNGKMWKIDKTGKIVREG